MNWPFLISISFRTAVLTNTDLLETGAPILGSRGQLYLRIRTFWAGNPDPEYENVTSGNQTKSAADELPSAPDSQCPVKTHSKVTGGGLEGANLAMLAPNRPLKFVKNLDSQLNMSIS